MCRSSPSSPEDTRARRNGQEAAHAVRPIRHSIHHDQWGCSNREAATLGKWVWWGKRPMILSERFGCFGITGPITSVIKSDTRKNTSNYIWRATPMTITTMTRTWKATTIKARDRNVRWKSVYTLVFNLLVLDFGLIRKVFHKKEGRGYFTLLYLALLRFAKSGTISYFPRDVNMQKLNQFLSSKMTHLGRPGKNGRILLWHSTIIITCNSTIQHTMMIVW